MDVWRENSIRWSSRVECVCHESSPWTPIRLPPEVALLLHRLSHYTDCYMSLRTTVPIIHCTDYALTSSTNQTRFISPGLPPSERRVLFCVYHSPSVNCYTEPFRVSV